jgi:phosphoglycerate dehydrogenase-like enzyme
MRLLLSARLQPASIDRLRALSPSLDVVDVSADDAFEIDALADPTVEIIVGRRAPADLTRVPGLRWLQVGSAGVDHLSADPPWSNGILVTNGRGVFAVPIGEYVSGAILRINAPIDRWASGQRSHQWPIDDEPVATVVRGQTAVLIGYGSICRVARLARSACGCRESPARGPRRRLVPRAAPGVRTARSDTDRWPQACSMSCARATHSS